VAGCDHPRTAATIAREAGLESDTIVTGEQIATWDDERLATELAGLHVVARSTPDQKLRLVRAARARRATAWCLYAPDESSPMWTGSQSRPIIVAARD
jgi:magnesium-transporting ATPase (P-type)